MNEPEQIEIPVDDLEKVEKKADDEVKIEQVEDPKEVVKTDVIDPEEGLNDLKAQLERERAARIEAERRAREAQETAHKANTEVHDSNLHLVNNAIDTVKQNNEILKANYREAMASGDYDQAAEIQQSMSTNAAKLLQLEQGKQALESQPKPQLPRQQASDPVEALASQLSTKSADWIRKNPQFVTNPRLYQKMIAAHQLAMADEIPADTPEYFEAIESTLGLRRQEARQSDDASEAAAKVTQRRSSPPAAPVTRSGTGTSNRPNTVRLTSAEREMAQMMGMSDQEYAKNKLALQREGKLN